MNESEPPAAPWRPISTAPRDGTRVILYNAYAGIWVGNYDGKNWPMFGWDGVVGVWYPEPTHWMPLPPPPDPKP